MVQIEYAVGLPQGEVLSVIGCNLISNTKMRQWTLHDSTNPITHNKGYTFACRDDQDIRMNKQANMIKKGYSDDYTFILHDGNTKTVQELSLIHI